MASAIIAGSVGWALVRANRDRIDTETDNLRDDITRRLRADVDTAHGVVAKLRARESLYVHLIRTHWLHVHPTEPLPALVADLGGIDDPDDIDPADVAD